ncbi:hypothetical protein AX16_005733 [Volvariella volvacea WC 439]|nr:hypothetical protein AX16_005733 [Volvariella volvacea WC 439]
MQFFNRFAFLVFATSGVQAHTFVWSVWVNGVDQGTGFGIREPAYIGPPLHNGAHGQGSGFRTSPVRDLNSIDMRCNVLGDIPDPDTIQVKPGDIVTFEWHHQTRTTADGIIDSSHKGAGLVYISPNPPTDNSWVKIQQEGEISRGQWYVTGKHTQRRGKQDVVVPPNLAPGQYLLRSELLTLHEAEVSHLNDNNRGLQIYIGCVQIEVTGNGTVRLPPGVGFPGAYKYTDPGIVYNLYYTAPGVTALYPIPGPTVWSGAAPSPNPPAYGTTKGHTTQTRWSTWIGTGFSPVTARTLLTIITGTASITQPYTPHWPTTYETPQPSPQPTSSSTSIPSTGPTVTTTTPTPSSSAPNGVVEKWGQCGGRNYAGPTQCVAGSTCTVINEGLLSRVVLSNRWTPLNFYGTLGDTTDIQFNSDGNPLS